MVDVIRKQKDCKVCGSEFMPFQTTQKVCGFKCAAIAGKESTKKKADKAKTLEDLFSDETKQKLLGVTAAQKARIEAWVPDYYD